MYNKTSATTVSANNNNNSGKSYGTYGRTAQAPATTPASVAVDSAPSRPGASLSIGVKGNGEGLDFHDITGLFNATDKKGNGFFKVSVKEEIHLPSGAALYVRPSENSTGIAARLSYGKSASKDSKMVFTDLTTLTSAADKSGKNYFKGALVSDIVIPAGSILFVHPKSK